MTKLFKLIASVLCGMNLAPCVIAAPLPEWAQAPSVQEIPALLLKDSVIRAFGRNPSIAQQAAQIGIGQSQIDEAQSAWYPKIGLSGNTASSKQTNSNGQLNNTASYGLALSQLIYDFGKTNNSVKQQEVITDSYRYQLMSTMSGVAEQTILAYLRVKRYQALHKAVEGNIESLESVRNMAKLRAEAGLSSSSDVLQAQTRISGMRSTLAQYRALLDTAKADLAVLTGVSSDTLPDLPKEIINQPIKVDHINYNLIPLVLMAQSQQDAAQYGVEKAKAAYWPTINLQGGRTRYESDSRAYWNDQLQLNVDAPLYQGGSVSSRVKQAEGALAMSRFAIEQAKLDVMQKASSSISNWTGAKDREQTGVLQLENARQTREVYKNEYKLSKRSLNDLLTVEQDVYQAEVAQLSADFDGWDAAVNYAAAVDNLLSLIGIDRRKNNELPDLK